VDVSHRQRWARTSFLSAIAVGLALLVGCPSDRVGRHVDPPAPSGSAEPGSPTVPDISSDVLAERLARLICLAYDDWPQSVLDGRADAELGGLLAEVEPERRAELESLTPAVRATERCPERIPPEGLAGGRLPRPAGYLEPMPGLFPPSPGLSPEEQRARYEWTAIGLGCLSLAQGGDAELGQQEADFLASMGYDLDSYVQASLAIDDPALSDRIFRAVLGCAQRRQALPAE
jgi:hypothetical protein